ncbi:hypothetical protein PFICI_03455 [Pestalotiopsis fici W106-1]|uniref:DUF1907 domain-containing protein n=1 Tax=Pestalotiopsis fici (strain W106-1 / CGMCC3.15140) TaxID=1229662 RepID=W3XHB8_PESFW|nr:uncharacterized protein PFICI_03455 [Pestalotiopsis fici W106-1]ETS85430.1 hypothetical protein PFICI_03455 [Pestalotiopsis fici W106-1]
MRVEKFPLSPPSLHDLAEQLGGPLRENYEDATVSVVDCPDLRQPPFHLCTEGLCGDEKISDVGGQPNLFPQPRLDSTWSMTDLARAMEMSAHSGGLIGAGAGPFHVVGQNCELAPNLSWKDKIENITNQSRLARIVPETNAVSLEKSPSPDCGLMVNLYGSLGQPGPILKITAKGRKGSETSFTECIRQGLAAAFGVEETISLGGVFVVKSGKALYHIMPEFPSEEQLPFKDRQQVDDWLTYHDFDSPMVCLSVFHSADPNNAKALRIEHTHCFSADGTNAGGHYHHESTGAADAIEYEAYFNTAKMIYRIDRPVS